MEKICVEVDKEKFIGVAKNFGILVLLLLIAYFVNTHIVRLAVVSGESMYPTLADKDILLINQVNYKPSRDDIVLIDISESQMLGQYIVKRIIAVEGDTVKLDYESNSVFVNGVKLSEPYLNIDQNDPMIPVDGNNNITYRIPTGTVFVMGDNRNHSTDSRSEIIGFVPEEYIIGKVLTY